MKTVHAGYQPVRRDRLVGETRHDPYQATQKRPEPTVCPGCGAVFHEGRWQWLTKPAGAHEEPRDEGVSRRFQVPKPMEAHGWRR